MNKNRSSSVIILSALGCLAFDIALLVAYFKIFGLFFIIDTNKSILMLAVLLFGLIVSNVVIVCPRTLFKNIKVPYTIAAINLVLVYVFIANILSILMITKSFVSYFVFELIIFSAFIFIFLVTLNFSKMGKEDNTKLACEKVDSTSVMLNLMEIEGILIDKKSNEDISSLRSLFKELKERIQASTPFGRINCNSEVFEVENQIKNNLSSIKTDLQVDYELSRLQKLIEDTKRLVINREKLNIN